MRIVIKSFLILGIIVSILTAMMTIRYYLGRHNADQINANLQKQKLVIPPVESAEILPVVEYLGADTGLRTEDGISYLIKAGDRTVLMDVGYNRKAERTSPFIHNLNRLGITFEAIDTLAISHCHPDHVGGMGFRQKKITFGSSPVELNGQKIYTPIPMICGSTPANTVEKPSLIAPAIGSTGPMAAQMFVPGLLREQSLLINIRGKGLVLISGCGHPEIIQMVKTAGKVTGIPVYAVVGGFHMYYTKVDGLFWRNLFGSSRLFSRSMTKQEVAVSIGKLKAMGIKKVFISPHDADQATLDLFAGIFGTDYQPVIAGKPIILGGR